MDRRHTTASRNPHRLCAVDSPETSTSNPRFSAQGHRSRTFFFLFHIRERSTLFGQTERFGATAHSEFGFGLEAGAGFERGHRCSRIDRAQWTGRGT